MSVSIRKAILFTNPTAGGKNEVSSEFKSSVIQALGLKEFRIEETRSSDFGRDQIRPALQNGSVDLVLVMGGDGTISSAIEGFLDEEGHSITDSVPLAVLPSGRGNDFFRMLSEKGVSSFLSLQQKGFQVLEKGSPQATDVGRIEFLNQEGGVQHTRHFINIVGFGFPGLVDHRVAQSVHTKGFLRKVIGKTSLTYFAESLAALAEYRSLRMQVKVDGNLVHEGSLFSGFVLNGAYNAGGVYWSSDVSIEDGIFHVLLFEDRSVFKVIQSLPNVKSGNWKNSSGIRQLMGKSLEVRLLDSPKGFKLFDVDGDQPEPDQTLGARMTILPSAVRLWRI